MQSGYRLTVADFDREKGQITVIFQEVGASTKKLAQFDLGQTILDVVGPLGKASHIEKFGTVVCIGGGVGVAPVYPIAKALHEAGNEIISIIGAPEQGDAHTGRGDEGDQRPTVRDDR